MNRKGNYEVGLKLFLSRGLPLVDEITETGTVLYFFLLFFSSPFLKFSPKISFHKQYDSI